MIPSLISRNDLYHTVSIRASTRVKTNASEKLLEYHINYLGRRLYLLRLDFGHSFTTYLIIIWRIDST